MHMCFLLCVCVLVFKTRATINVAGFTVGRAGVTVRATVSARAQGRMHCGTECAYHVGEAAAWYDLLAKSVRFSIIFGKCTHSRSLHISCSEGAAGDIRAWEDALCYWV